ncbi:Clp protease N-terminal domain-containing protein [Nonomuraea sp. NPDC050536]|uniref:Clp protease N-terminal domain-containing protein n=1 Tax=Nonomuraea sp. NPDC050536 TaxID=3364366 RepID=UPI0037CBA548
MSAFDKYLHTIIVQAGAEAQKEGSATVEAQHLLLAIAANSGSSAQRVLAGAGLDERAIRDALAREFDHSLAVAGVSRAAFDLPPATPDHTRDPDLGASAKLALERGFASASRKRDLRSGHLLLGILQAEVGTVPRALALAGTDRTALLDEVHQTLTSPTP